MHISEEMILVRSDDIVAREIAGELILIPISGGVGDVQNDIYALNETGREIWERLDGRKTVGEIVADLLQLYHGSEEIIREDVFGLLSEIGKRRFITVGEGK